jgi:hypothetical protein
MNEQVIATQRGTIEDGRAAAMIAQHRGWTGIELSGSDDFRRGAWIEADARDIEAWGYKPSDQDKVDRFNRAKELEAEPERGLDTDLEHLQQSKRAADTSIGDVMPETTGLDMDGANIDGNSHAADASLASGVRGSGVLQSTPGNESDAQPGRADADTAAGAIERSEAVRSMTPRELVEAYPDMRQEAGVIAAADAFAAEKIESADDQTRFTAAIRDQVAERVAEGEQFAEMNIKEERAIERSSEATQETESER